MTTGGVCSDDNVTACTIANESIDCGGSNTCLTAPQAGPWHPVVGAFEISFYAMGSGTSAGTPQVSVCAGPDRRHQRQSYFYADQRRRLASVRLSRSPAPTRRRARKTLMVFTLTGSNNTAETGATIYVDDIYLGKTTTSATGFRSEVMTTLQAINPGSLRYANYQQLGTNDAAMKAPAAARQATPLRVRPGPATISMGRRISTAERGTWTFAASDTYPLANSVGRGAVHDARQCDERRRPQESSLDNLCTAVTNNYFSSAWVEASNENWNNGAGRISFGSQNLGTLGYGGDCGRNFSIMSTEAIAHCHRRRRQDSLHIRQPGLQQWSYPRRDWRERRRQDSRFPTPASTARTTRRIYPNTDRAAESKWHSCDAGGGATRLTSSASPGYVGAPGTGCVNNGLYGDYGLHRLQQYHHFYETGPNGYSPPGSTEQAYLSEAGFPSAAWMAESWLMGQQLGQDADSERVSTGANRVRQRWNRGTHLGRGPRPRQRLRTYLPAFASDCNGSGSSQQRHRRGLLSG